MKKWKAHACVHDACQCSGVANEFAFGSIVHSSPLSTPLHSTPGNTSQWVRCGLWEIAAWARVKQRRPAAGRSEGVAAAAAGLRERLTVWAAGSWALLLREASAVGGEPVGRTFSLTVGYLSHWTPFGPSKKHWNARFFFCISEFFFLWN